ncbi:uncharacterized protein GlcG (DUF336 family) [Stackebrandtia albiflava]|uniref:Uncharacterized protein GlcG (DUF336 family) n=1 Tax=Stackebrandtia albiflava TaxID=406432 RepID=A0A562UL45_9ACTN|nr:heme-binding protein [Stackebrandtia albiflava]TWJ06335.1 uncharacterized protein GlcG (DUF336 family) [Stackebrandtia albiflava]
MNLHRNTVRITTGAIAGLAIVGGVLATATYAEPSSPETSSPRVTTVTAVEDDDVATGRTLPSDAVSAVLAAAQDAADERGVRVTVAVVDRAGNTIGLLKDEGAGPQTAQSAIDKAFTAVSFGQATGDLGKAASGNKPNIGDIPGTLFLPGGVPVTFEDAPIAGVGVGGAPDGAIDEEIASAAIAALG